MSQAKPSPAQRSALQMIQRWGTGGIYMPFADQRRSFEACARKGLAVYRSVDNGHAQNGYALTEAGREELNSRP